MIIIGMIGTLLYLGSYIAIQYKPKFVSTISYSMINVIAAIFVLISLQQDWNLPSAITQVIWIIASFYGIYKAASFAESVNAKNICDEEII